MSRKRKVLTGLGVALSALILGFFVGRIEIDRRARARAEALQGEVLAKCRELGEKRWLRPAEGGPWIAGNAWDDYGPASAALGSLNSATRRGLGAFLHGKPGAYSPDEVAGLLVTHAPQAALAENGLRREEYTWRTDWARGSSAARPHYGGFRSLGTLFLARARLARLRGDHAAAVEDAIRAGRLARDLESLPLLISAMIETGILKDVAEEGRALVTDPACGQADLEVLADGLRGLRGRDRSIGRYFDAERTLMAPVFRGWSRAGGGGIEDIDDIQETSRTLVRTAPYLFSTDAWMVDQLECYWKTLGEWAAGRTSARCGSPDSHVFCSIAMPGLVRTEESWNLHRTRLAAVEAASLVRIHRLRTGSWPAALDEIGAPNDPVTGRPLPFEVSENAARIVADDEFSIEIPP